MTSDQLKAVGFLTEFSKQMVVTAFLEKHIPAAAASSLVKGIYHVFDDVSAGCLKSGTKLACKKGCSLCCFLRVKLTPLEILCILDYLLSRLKPGEISALRGRIAELDEVTRGLDGLQRVQAKRICPLNIDDICLVYPVRPITCRIYHSLDVFDCQLSLDDDQHSLAVRNDISGMGMGVFAGLTEGLREAGLQTRLVELIAGLRIAMDEPDLTRSWLAGALAFRDAEIEDAKGIESFHSKLVEALGETVTAAAQQFHRI